MEFSLARLRIIMFEHSHQSSFLPNGRCVVGNGTTDVWRNNVHAKCAHTERVFARCTSRATINHRVLQARECRPFFFFFFLQRRKKNEGKRKNAEHFPLLEISYIIFSPVHIRILYTYRIEITSGCEELPPVAKPSHPRNVYLRLNAVVPIIREKRMILHLSWSSLMQRVIGYRIMESIMRSWKTGFQNKCVFHLRSPRHLLKIIKASLMTPLVCSC